MIMCILLRPQVPVIELTNKSYSVLDTIFELMNSEPITQSDKYGIQFISQLVHDCHVPAIQLIILSAIGRAVQALEINPMC